MLPRKLASFYVADKVPDGPPMFSLFVFLSLVSNSGWNCSFSGRLAIPETMFG
jgi:hypothetical protein